MSYDDPVSADEVVRSIAAGAREGMAQVMQLGANALRAPEDAESVAEALTRPTSPNITGLARIFLRPSRRA